MSIARALILTLLIRVSYSDLCDAQSGTFVFVLRSKQQKFQSDCIRMILLLLFLFWICVIYNDTLHDPSWLFQLLLKQSYLIEKQIFILDFHVVFSSYCSGNTNLFVFTTCQLLKYKRKMQKNTNTIFYILNKNFSCM